MKRFITMLAMLAMLTLSVSASARPHKDGPHDPPPPPHHGAGCPCQMGDHHGPGPHHGGPHMGGHHGPMSRIAHLVKELRLTPAQEDNIKNIKEDFKKKADAQKDEMKKALDTLIALESTLPLDKAAIIAAQNKVDAFIKAERDIRLDMDIAIVNVLTDGQKRKLAEELAKKPEPGKCNCGKGCKCHKNGPRDCGKGHKDHRGHKGHR